MFYWIKGTTRKSSGKEELEGRCKATTMGIRGWELRMTWSSAEQKHAMLLRKYPKNTRSFAASEPPYVVIT
jgi:hypothetical protein